MNEFRMPEVIHLCIMANDECHWHTNRKFKSDVEEFLDRFLLKFPNLETISGTGPFPGNFGDSDDDLHSGILNAITTPPARLPRLQWLKINLKLRTDE